tara:strand:- start:615 stop:1061 length:447 start_codon:yes stop_codon:yes gene_type:complete
MLYKRRKGKKTIQSKKKVIDGIQFDSTLESFMYKLLKDNNIENEYEGEKFILIDSFHFSNSSFERTATKPMIDRGDKNVRGITYKPDFVSDKFIIEVKGRANESFPIRWKLFKRLLHNNNDTRVLYKPQSQADCKTVVEDILNRFYND